MILGNTHRPLGPARGTVILAHGFKGYKDYGFIPLLASHLARRGWIAHRFNFSHSGMTNETDTFARCDLFALDTWNRQVDDLIAVMRAIHDGRLAGQDLPIVLLGHSRGGVTVLLTAGRIDCRGDVPQPRGIITIAAPSSTCRLAERERALMREQGYLDSPSSRTGQMLRIGRQWLDEIEADPESHDVLALAQRISAPQLILHGVKDATVGIHDARELASAVGRRATFVELLEGNHVLNTPNPADSAAAPSESLLQAMDAIDQFLDSISPTGQG